MPLFGLPGLPGLPDGTRVHHSLHEQIHDGVELDVGGDLPGMAPGSSKIGVASAGRPVNNNTIAFTTTSMWGVPDWGLRLHQRLLGGGRVPQKTILWLRTPGCQRSFVTTARNAERPAILAARTERQ